MEDILSFVRDKYHWDVVCFPSLGLGTGINCLLYEFDLFWEDKTMEWIHLAGLHLHEMSLKSNPIINCYT